MASRLYTNADLKPRNTLSVVKEQAAPRDTSVSIPEEMAAYRAEVENQQRGLTAAREADLDQRFGGMEREIAAYDRDAAQRGPDRFKVTPQQLRGGTPSLNALEDVAKAVRMPLRMGNEGMIDQAAQAAFGVDEASENMPWWMPGAGTFGEISLGNKGMDALGGLLGKATGFTKWNEGRKATSRAAQQAKTATYAEGGYGPKTARQTKPSEGGFGPKPTPPSPPQPSSTGTAWEPGVMPQAPRGGPATPEQFARSFDPNWHGNVFSTAGGPSEMLPGMGVGEIPESIAALGGAGRGQTPASAARILAGNNPGWSDVPLDFPEEVAALVPKGKKGLVGGRKGDMHQRQTTGGEFGFEDLPKISEAELTRLQKLFKRTTGK